MTYRVCRDSRSFIEAKGFDTLLCHRRCESVERATPLMQRLRGIVSFFFSSSATPFFWCTSSSKQSELITLLHSYVMRILCKSKTWLDIATIISRLHYNTKSFSLIKISFTIENYLKYFRLQGISKMYSTYILNQKFDSIRCKKGKYCNRMI